MLLAWESNLRYQYGQSIYHARLDFLWENAFGRALLREALFFSSWAVIIQVIYGRRNRLGILNSVTSWWWTSCGASEMQSWKGLFMKEALVSKPHCQFDAAPVLLVALWHT